MLQLNQFYCERFLKITTKNDMRCSNSGTETTLGKYVVPSQKVVMLTCNCPIHHVNMDAGQLKHSSEYFVEMLATSVSLFKMTTIRNL